MRGCEFLGLGFRWMEGDELTVFGPSSLAFFPLLLSTTSSFPPSYLHPCHPPLLTTSTLHRLRSQARAAPPANAARPAGTGGEWY